MIYNRMYAWGMWIGASTLLMLASATSMAVLLVAMIVLGITKAWLVTATLISASVAVGSFIVTVASTLWVVGFDYTRRAIRRRWGLL